MRFVLLSRNAALYSTSRIIRSARARGHEVDVVDPLQLQIAVLPSLPGVLYAGRPLPPYHAAIPRIGASITGHGTAVLQQFERLRVPTLNSAHSILLSRDKIRSLQVLAERRIVVPRTVCTRSLAGVHAALERVGGCPAVVKLQHGTQGIGTMLAETSNSLFALLETLWAMGQQIVLQELVREARGQDIRVLVVGGTVVAAMRRKARRGEFRSNLHRGAHGLAVALPPRYQRTALRAAAAVGLDVAGVDILESTRGPVVVEVNSSPGLEGIERATGIDVAAPIVELAVRKARAARRRG